MKRFLILGMTILCSMCSVTQAYCEPTESIQESVLADEPPETETGNPETDPYTGLPIDWAGDTADGEAGVEDETYASQGMVSPTMSSSEAAEAAAIVESMKETQVAYGNTTGVLQFVCELPDDFPGYTIEALVYDDNFKKTVVDCYAKNGYIAMTNLPTGHYMIGDVYVPNDNGTRYPMITDCKDFTISENEQKIVTVTMAKTIKVPVKTEEASDGNETSITNQTSTARTIIFVAALVGFALIGFIVGKKMMNKDRFE